MFIIIIHEFQPNLLQEVSSGYISNNWQSDHIYENDNHKGTKDTKIFNTGTHTHSKSAQSLLREFKTLILSTHPIPNYGKFTQSSALSTTP